MDITAVSKADQIVAGTANPYAVRLNSSNAQDGAVIADILATHLDADRYVDVGIDDDRIAREPARALLGVDRGAGAGGQQNRCRERDAAHGVDPG